MYSNIHFCRRSIPSAFRCCLFFLLVALVAFPARATTVIPPSFDELVGKSDYVVHAVVKSVHCEWRTTGANRQIFTKIELEVKEVIAGDPPSPLVLEMLGGKMGDEHMVVNGAPEFNVGDEDILFLHGNGQYLNPLVALAYGRYPIKRDKKSGLSFMTRSNGEPLSDEKQLSRSLSPTEAPKTPPVMAKPLRPEAFLDRIKLSRQANPRPIRAK